MNQVFIILVAVCAIAYAEDGHRIAGGQNADIRQLQYQLSLETFGWHLCGASIISEYWALTAAHCVYNSEAKQFAVRAGSNIPLVGGHVHQVVQLVYHPKYTSINEDYDYALIKVETPFALGEEGVQAIKLSEVEPKNGKIAVTSGWGALSSGGPSPNQLQKVEVPIIDRATCKKMYADYEYPISDITDRMICAGLRKGGKDSCEKDSGGPLAVDGVLVGIVSWGIGCAHPNRPGVYSNVADQRDWIRQVASV